MDDLERISKIDLATFLRTDELGDIANWNGRSFDVQFFHESDAVNIFGVDIELTNPFFFARDEDIADISQGVTVIVGNLLTDVGFQDTDVLFIDADVKWDKTGQGIFKVVKIYSDATGMSIIFLSKD